MRQQLAGPVHSLRGHLVLGASVADRHRYGRTLASRRRREHGLDLRDGHLSAAQHLNACRRDNLDNRRLDANGASPAIDNTQLRVAGPQVLEYVKRRCGAHVAEGVGAGGRDGDGGGAEERQGDGMVRNADANEAGAASDGGRNVRRGARDNRQWARPQLRAKAGGERGAGSILLPFGAPQLGALCNLGHVADEGVRRWPPLHRVDVAAGLVVQRVGAEAVDGLGGEGDEVPGAEALGGEREGLLIAGDDLRHCDEGHCFVLECASSFVFRINGDVSVLCAT